MATSMTITRPSLSLEFGNKYGIDQNKVFSLLKETALKSKDPVSDSEVAAFMVVANQYDLNPFTKEIYGFMSKGKMQYVISVDGWLTLINRNPNLNGIEFEEHFTGDKADKIDAITCRIHRKDRALPTVVTEYHSECYRPPVNGSPGPWQSHPIRMLRHKALIQCARVAFGLAGVMDEDEAERLAGYYDSPVIDVPKQSSADDQVDALRKSLGWTDAKLRMAKVNFGGDRAGLIAHLRAELAKTGVKQEPIAEVREEETVVEDAEHEDAYSNDVDQEEPLVLTPEPARAKARNSVGF